MTLVDIGADRCVTIEGDPVRVSICHCLACPEATPGIVAVPVGAFADPSFPAPTRSVWEERRHSWLRLPDDIEHVS
jgi:hypothetical protein